MLPSNPMAHTTIQGRAFRECEQCHIVRKGEDTCPVCGSDEHTTHWLRVGPEPDLEIMYLEEEF